MPALRELQLAFVAAMFDESHAVERPRSRRGHERRRAPQHLPEQSARRIHQGAGARLPSDRATRRQRITSGSSRWSSSPRIRRAREICITSASPSRRSCAQKLPGRSTRTSPTSPRSSGRTRKRSSPPMRTRFHPTHSPAIAPEDYERLTFAFHPACRFVQSRYPIVKIWRANQPETLSDELIDLDSGGDNVLVLRTPECVEFHSAAGCSLRLVRSAGSRRTARHGTRTRSGGRDRPTHRACDRVERLRSRRRAPAPHGAPGPPDALNLRTPRNVVPAQAH